MGPIFINDNDEFITGSVKATRTLQVLHPHGGRGGSTSTSPSYAAKSNPPDQASRSTPASAPASSVWADSQDQTASVFQSKCKQERSLTHTRIKASNQRRKKAPSSVANPSRKKKKAGKKKSRVLLVLGFLSSRLFFSSGLDLQPSWVPFSFFDYLP